MPANKAIICIDGREYDIELLQYQFVLPCNTIEKPHFFVKDGLLRFCIDSTDDNYILEKMLSTQNSAILQGSINVFGNDDDMPIRRISFEEGYVVYYREEMSLLYGENFSIHGGKTPGSAGCIDITSNDVHFFKQVTKYRRDCTKIQLIVKYK